MLGKIINTRGTGMIVHLIALLSCSFGMMAQPANDSLMHVLKVELENSHSYYVQKDKKITSLKQSLEKTDNWQSKSEMTELLFNEYITYQYDSAYHYARLAVEFARQHGDRSSMTKAQINMLHCYVASGLFKEAYQQMSSIDIGDSFPALKVQYYSLAMRLYTNMMLNESNPFYEEYAAQALAYSDSIKMNLDNGTPEYAYYELLHYNLSEKECKKRIYKYEQILKTYNFSGTQYATIYIYLGRDYERLGDMTHAIYYTTLSALYDIRSSIRQTTAKTYLGEYLYNKGEVMFASKCIQAALDDANFYNAQHRKIHVNSVLPIIEAEKMRIIEEQKYKLSLFLGLVCVLVIALLCLIAIIYKQLKKLKHARQVIEEHFNEINRVNEQLALKNHEVEESYRLLSISTHQLEEVNEIKDVYITQSLCGKSDYLDRFESLIRKVERKVQAKQYQDLNKLYLEFNLKGEREKMFSSFDKTFLILFPHFVEEYNKLFAPEEQITLDENGNLVPELRIFALMRLGITENERIAKFLNLSVKTVYSYRYKARIRANVPKEEFEYMVMRIKKKTDRHN